MALYVPLGRVARASLRAARVRACGAASLADSGGACGARDVPPCPPCRPAPRPPCRPAPQPQCRAKRVVCCAPPQGARPPCEPQAPACPLTCRDSIDQSRDSFSHVRDRDPLQNESSGCGCGCDQDPVALRLQLAQRARRAEYEREVASRAALAAAPPAPPATPALYSLGGERECARATDGCTYAVLRPPAAHPAPRTRCGPGRTPPPPRCVPLAPDDGCRIKGDAHLDPCAHRPRVMIQVDRSNNATAPARLQNSTRGGGSGHPSWCENPPEPAAAPPRCRHPTIVERLRARPPDSQSERRIHTSVALSKAGKSVRSESGGLEGMLRSKEQLKEAGLGRFVIDTGEGRASQVKPPGGKLELSVPPGTERVAVLVSLDVASPACPKSSPTAVSSGPACEQTSSVSCANFTATTETRDPWLSIKKFQKKLTGRCEQASIGLKAEAQSAGTGCPEKSPAPQCSSPKPAPQCSSPRPAPQCGSLRPAPSCGAPTLTPGIKPTGDSSRCEPSTPVRCGGLPNGSKTETKQCSSTSTFLANTILVNSLLNQP